jgi:hypothetical protein
MKNVLVGIVAAAGLATVASAQSTLKFEVRPVGGTEWVSNLSVAPGTQVEFRALISYTGTATNFGFSSGVFQPTIKNWNTGLDTLASFVNQGGGAAGGVDAGAGYGRIRPFSQPGISSTNFLRGHINNRPDGTYLRIAQNNTTNWAGVGPTSGTGAVNNFNGSGGVTLTQKSANNVIVGTDPAYNPAIQNVELVRFAFTVGGLAERTLEVSTPAESIQRNATSGLRVFNWYATATESAGSLRTTAEIIPAFVTVPTPGALALVGLGGLVVARRRR